MEQRHKMCLHDTYFLVFVVGISLKMFGVIVLKLVEIYRWNQGEQMALMFLTQSLYNLNLHSRIMPAALLSPAWLLLVPSYVPHTINPRRDITWIPLYSLIHLGLFCIKPLGLPVSFHQPHTTEANDVNTAHITALSETAGESETRKLSVKTWWEG